MKISIPRSTIVTVVVAALLIGLVVGLGFIQGKSSTVTQDLTEYQTQTVPVNQIITQTMTSVVTTTFVSLSNLTFSNSTTILAPTTLTDTSMELQNVTKFQNQTITQTVQAATSSGTAIITLASNYLLEFSVNQPELQILQASFTPGFDGYIQVNFQSNSTIHWVLAGNDVNETSPSQSSGEVNFPVNAFVRYSLFVYNDECDFAGCGTPFNATASIYYIYEH